MATKTKTKKKPGYVSEAKGRLFILTPEIIHRVVDHIPETEDSDLASEVNSKLARFTKVTIPEMESRIQEREKKSYVSEAHGQIKVFSPEVIQRIVDRIKEAEVTAPLLEDLVWTRRLDARPFAQKLFNSAQKRMQLEGCYSDLKRAVELSKNRNIVSFLEDTEARFRDKAEFLSSELGDTKNNNLVLNLIYKLLTKRTLDMLPDITDEYGRLFDNHNSIVWAQVTTAISLNDEDKLRISKRLGDMIGKKVIIESVVDPGIIGGIVVRVGDKLLDGSIRSKLVSMKSKLTRQ